MWAWMVVVYKCFEARGGGVIHKHPRDIDERSPRSYLMEEFGITKKRWHLTVDIGLQIPVNQISLQSHSIML